MEALYILHKKNKVPDLRLASLFSASLHYGRKCSLKFLISFLCSISIFIINHSLVLKMMSLLDILNCSIAPYS